MSKLYRLKYDDIVSAERRRNKLAFHLEVTYFDLLESKQDEKADDLYNKWITELNSIDEALNSIKGCNNSPKVEGRFWAIITRCKDKVSAL